MANTDDVADWDGAGRLVRQAVDTFGGLDVLVCNAGILRDRMLDPSQAPRRVELAVQRVAGQLVAVLGEGPLTGLGDGVVLTEHGMGYRAGDEA